MSLWACKDRGHTPTKFLCVPAWFHQGIFFPCPLLGALWSVLPKPLPSNPRFGEAVQIPEPSNLWAPGMRSWVALRLGCSQCTKPDKTAGHWCLTYTYHWTPKVLTHLHSSNFPLCGVTGRNTIAQTMSKPFQTSASSWFEQQPRPQWKAWVLLWSACCGSGCIGSQSKLHAQCFSHQDQSNIQWNPWVLAFLQHSLYWISIARTTEES